MSGIYDFKNHKNELNFLLKQLRISIQTQKFMQHLQFLIYYTKKENLKKVKYLKIANDEGQRYKKSDSNLKIKYTEFYKSLKVKNSKIYI